MNTSMQSDRILRMRELPGHVGIKKSLIYELIKKGDFPRAVKLGERARGWRQSDIVAWVAKRRAA